MNYYAIIVGGGTGNRMNNTVPKQFLLLDNMPVLMHTIQAFHKCVLNPEILVVLNSKVHDQWKELCQTYRFEIPHILVEGGKERFHSVKKGLSAITCDGLVAIHDAVRPLVSPSLILRSYESALKTGNCVAGVSPTDSIRKIESDGTTRAFNRNQFSLIQTPQTFQLKVIRKAYLTAYNDSFTDDATVLENSGIKINIITGERDNIKITYPEDIDIASILLKKKRSS